MRLALGLRIVVTIFATTATLRAGTISGCITDLLGDPRGGIEIHYQVHGIDADSRLLYPIEATQALTTVASGTNAGTFNFKIRDDMYRPKTKAVRITLMSDDLDTIVLEPLLGTETQNLQIVMPKRLSAPVVALVERPSAVYTAGPTTFHLFGKSGTGFYHLHDGTSKLVKLEKYHADPTYVHFRETSASRRSWAFGREPTLYCVLHGCHYIVRCRGFAVWHSVGRPRRWQFLGWMHRLRPDNTQETFPIDRGESASQTVIDSADTQFRSWADASGRHRIDAALVAVDPRTGRITLRAKNTRRRVTVAVKLLSPHDRDYISRAVSHVLIR